eukprot:g16305.t1
MLSQQGQKKFAWLHPVKSLAAAVDHYELRELTWFSFHAFADGLINGAVRLVEEWLVFIQFLLKHASLATGSAQLSKKARNRWQVANGRVGILDDAQHKAARFLGAGRWGLVDSESGKRGNMVEKMLKANQQSGSRRGSEWISLFRFFQTMPNRRAKHEARARAGSLQSRKRRGKNLYAEAAKRIAMEMGHTSLFSTGQQPRGSSEKVVLDFTPMTNWLAGWNEPGITPVQRKDAKAAAIKEQDKEAGKGGGRKSAAEQEEEEGDVEKDADWVRGALR